MPLAFARILREFSHQKFIGVTQYIVATCTVLRKVQFGLLKNFNKAGQFIHCHLISSQFFTVEVGNIDNAFQVIDFCQFADDNVDTFTYILCIFELNDVIKASTFRYLDIPVVAALETVRHIFDEQ